MTNPPLPPENPVSDPGGVFFWTLGFRAEVRGGFSATFPFGGFQGTGLNTGILATQRDSEMQQKPPTPAVINWHVTEACNYRCGYCYAHWDRPSRTEVCA